MVEQIVKRSPHPKQSEALCRTEFEVLYWWARWWWKTDAGMVKPLYFTDNPKFRCLVIRKNYDDLVDWISRAREMYSHLWVNIVWGKEITFPSGAVIRLWHLKDENAYTKYQGHEYQMMIIEELTQIPSEDSYLKLIASCRSTVDWLHAQIFATTNPWEIWHLWVKKRFIDVALPWQVYIDPITSRSRIFIPSRIEDNPTLMTKDPDYVKFLEWLPEDLKKAWRDGSWDVFDSKGSFYSQYIMEARKTNRICHLPYDKLLTTYKFRDLWIDDNMVITVCQFFWRELRIIDCIRGNDVWFEHYIPIIRERYGLENMYFPHDIEVKELSSGMSRKQTLENMWIQVNKTPNISIEDGIQAVRLLFQNMWFDVEKTEKLIEALNIYRKKRDEKNLVFGKPIHDWSSDFADSIRYMAVCYQNIIQTEQRRTIISKPKLVVTDPVLNNLPKKNTSFYQFNSNQRIDDRQSRV